MTEISIAVSAIGTFFAYIEIWHPRIIKLIERQVGNHLSSNIEFKCQLKTDVEVVGKRFEVLLPEVLKGPQFDKTPERSKEEMMVGLHYTKKSILLYFAVLLYLLVLFPLNTVIKYLGGLGKGRFVGGLGIFLNVVGLTIAILSR
ncbi:hypothetical protein [Marinimicrobium agarilyticum]|uniref:hypothetical protein n=1 Tax=Marinimicrobium agarilyticum TaxID=306546 RepID=UPI00047FF535|nr:hypothetical protein [Marinimicrobium agarilyticum]